MTTRLRAHSSVSFAPDRFVWSERSKVNYQEAFSSQVIQNKVNNVKKDVSSDKNDVDDLISNISDIIVSAGDMTGKRKFFGVKKKKPRKFNKKWFDRDCHILLKEKFE